MSLVNSNSSLGSKNFLGMLDALSNLSPPKEYGIRLLENAIPVSYLHPVKNGVLPDGLKPVSDSERAALGDVTSAPLVMGGGIRASSESFRACIDGVDGRELDW